MKYGSKTPKIRESKEPFRHGWFLEKARPRCRSSTALLCDLQQLLTHPIVFGLNVTTLEQVQSSFFTFSSRPAKIPGLTVYLDEKVHMKYVANYLYTSSKARRFYLYFLLLLPTQALQLFFNH